MAAVKFRKRFSRIVDSTYPCPVEGCRQRTRRSTIVVCTNCWAQVPPQLRQYVASAWEALRRSEVSNRAELQAQLEEAKNLAIVAAEGVRLRDEIAERRRARTRDRLRHGRGEQRLVA